MSYTDKEKLMSFIATSIIEYAGLHEDFIGHALEHINIEQPSDENIKKAVDNYHSAGNETTLRIQEVNNDGNVIDEYDLPAPNHQLDYEDLKHKKSTCDQLLNLARQERLMIGIGDHNYRSTYKTAVQLLAHNHTGYQIEDGMVSIPGPLENFISEERQGELWQEFLIAQDLDPALYSDMDEATASE